jgi:hypothetical protein
MGHVAGFDPYGIPILRPTPIWSLFDRLKQDCQAVLAEGAIFRHLAQRVLKRRNALANPSRMSALSRAPISPVVRSVHYCTDVLGERRCLRCRRRPFVRRIPFIVFLTIV